MRSAYRTPSPEKAAPEGNRKHSPWTAQRARKKGKNSPDAKPGLPDVDENDMEDIELVLGGQHNQSSDKQLACVSNGRACHLCFAADFQTLRTPEHECKPVTGEAGQRSLPSELLLKHLFA